jgi:hypothetical protein
MSAVAVMAAQNPFDCNGIQMARNASKFKIIPAVRMMRRRQRRRPRMLCTAGGLQAIEFSLDFLSCDVSHFNT